MSDFAVFKNGFVGDLVVPTDSEYETAICHWAINAIQCAKVVAFVKCVADVGLAISYAKANELPIAVRGAGHNPYSARSSSEDGLVIDLSS